MSIIRRLVPASAVRLLQPIKRFFQIWGFRERVVEHSYGGHIFKVHLRDPMSQTWYDADWPQREEVEFLARSKLKDGATVFDLGAHQCVVAMILAKTVGDSGKVIAVELDPFNASVARQNLRTNKIENVVLLEKMISSTTGGEAFASFQLNAAPVKGAGLGSRKVTSVSVDELAATYGAPDVIYVDVEGYEWEALKGARNVINSHADWCIELHGDEVLSNFGATNKAVARIFEQNNFVLYIGEEGGNFQPIASAASVPAHRCYLAAIRQA